MKKKYYSDNSIKKYIEDLASRTPAPGGGSSAALAGAIGTALIEMAANYTLGNDLYKKFEKDVKSYAGYLKKIEKEFILLMDEDVTCYLGIRKAFKSKDAKNIDRALKSGYDISLRVLGLSLISMNIAQKISSKCNINLVTDVGCGALFLNTAARSSILNCNINLKDIKDKRFRKIQAKVLKEAERKLNNSYNRAIMNVNKKIGS